MEQHFRGVLGFAHRCVLAAANAISGPDTPWRRRLSPAYAAALLALSGGRGVPAELNGEIFRLDPRYRWRLPPNYEAELAAFLRTRIAPGHCCVDVGANVGAYVLQMARWTAPDGHIVAFEPNADTFAVLRRHVRMNGLDARVPAVQSAVGRSTGSARLFDAAPGSGLSRLGGPNPSIVQEAAHQHVALTTLDDFFVGFGRWPDWVLVDVEGYEFEVLAGARETIDRVAGVVVEMHPHLWPAGSGRAEGERLLAALGRRPAPIGGTDPWAAGAVLLEPVLAAERDDQGEHG